MILKERFATGSSEIKTHYSSIRVQNIFEKNEGGVFIQISRMSPKCPSLTDIRLRLHGRAQMKIVRILKRRNAM